MLQSIWGTLFGMPAQTSQTMKAQRLEGFYAASGYVAALNAAINASAADGKPAVISSPFPTSPATATGLTTDVKTLAVRTAQLERVNYRRLYGIATTVLGSQAFTGTDVPNITPVKTYLTLNGQAVPADSNTITALGTMYSEYRTASTALFALVRTEVTRIIGQYSELTGAFATFRGTTSASIDTLAPTPALATTANTLGTLTYSDTNVTTLRDAYATWGPDSFTAATSPNANHRHTLMLQFIRTELLDYITKFFTEYGLPRYNGGLRDTITLPSGYTVVAPHKTPLVSETVTAQDLIDLMTAFGPLTAQLLNAGNQNDLRVNLAAYRTLYNSISPYMTDAEKDRTITGVSSSGVSSYTYATFNTAAAETTGALWQSAASVPAASFATTNTTYITALGELYNFTLNRLLADIALYEGAHDVYGAFQTKFNESTGTVIVGTVPTLPATQTRTFNYPVGSPTTYSATLVALRDATPRVYNEANQTIITNTINKYLITGTGEIATLRTNINTNLVTWAGTFNGRFDGSSATFKSLLPTPTTLTPLSVPATATLTILAGTTIPQFSRATAQAVFEIISALNTRTAHLGSAIPPATVSAVTTYTVINSTVVDAVNGFGTTFETLKTTLGSRYGTVRTAQSTLNQLFDTLKSTFVSFRSTYSTAQYASTVDNEIIALPPSQTLNTVPAQQAAPPLGDVSALLNVVAACGPDSTVVTPVPATIPNNNQLPNVITFIRNELDDYLTKYQNAVAANAALGIAASPTTATDLSVLRRTTPNPSSAQELIDIMNRLSELTTGWALANLRRDLRGLMLAFRDMYNNFQPYLFVTTQDRGTDLETILTEIENAGNAASANWTFTGMNESQLRTLITNYTWPASGTAAAEPNKWATLVAAVKLRLNQRLVVFGNALVVARNGPSAGVPGLFTYPGIAATLSGDLNTSAPDMTAITAGVTATTATSANLHTLSNPSSLYSITVRFFQTTLSPSPASSACAPTPVQITRPSNVGLEQFLGQETTRIEALIAARNTARDTLERYYDDVYARFQPKGALANFTSVAATYMNIAAATKPRNLMTDMTSVFNNLCLADLNTLNNNLTTGISNMYNLITDYIRARDAEYRALYDAYQTFYTQRGGLRYISTAQSPATTVTLLDAMAAAGPSAALSSSDIPALGTGAASVFNTLLATLNNYINSATGYIPSLRRFVRDRMKEFIIAFNNAYTQRFGGAAGQEGSLAGVFVTMGPSGADTLFSYRSFEADLAKVNDTSVIPTSNDLFLDTTIDSTNNNNIPQLRVGLIPRYERLYLIFGDMSEKMRALMAMDAWYDKYLQFQGCAWPVGFKPPALAPILDELTSYIDTTTGVMSPTFNAPPAGITYTTIAQNFYLTHAATFRNFANDEIAKLVNKFKGQYTGEVRLPMPYTYYELWVRFKRKDAGISDSNYDTSVSDSATSEMFGIMNTSDIPPTIKNTQALQDHIFGSPQQFCMIRDAIAYVEVKTTLDQYSKCVVNEVKHSNDPGGLKFI